MAALKRKGARLHPLRAQHGLVHALIGRAQLRRSAILLSAVFAALTCPHQSNAACLKGLGDLPGGIFSSEALGLSTDGAVVVGSSDSESGLQAFRWTLAGGMVGLGDLTGGTYASTAEAVSA